MIDTLKAPPHSKEAEQSLIGGLIMSNNRFDDISHIVKEEDFYGHQNGILFKAISALASKGKPFDAVTISTLLESRNRLDEIGGLQYIAEIANNTPSSANIVSYANIIKERSILRSLIKFANGISSRAYDNQENDSSSILESAYDALRSITVSGETDVPSLLDTMTSAFKQLEQRFQNKGELTGLSTGFNSIDKRTNGLQKGELYIIAGRPAMGKSTIALNISANAALNGHHVLFFSLEMPRERIIDKCWSSIGSVYYESIKTGKMETEQWAYLTNAHKRLIDSGLVVDDRGDQDLQHMLVKARRMNSKKKIDLIVIDYLQLVRIRKLNRFEEVSEVSRQLKALAKNLNCPVVALSQLSRGVESRADKRPMLQDLRESGQIEQDADVIMFMYRDEYYNKESQMNKNVAELITAKHRFGQTGTDYLLSELNVSRFRDLPEGVNYIAGEIKENKAQGLKI